MAPAPENRSTFSRYRRPALLAFGALGGAFALLVTASIVIELFASDRARGDAARPDPALQLACNQEVTRLLDTLVREAARIELMPLDGVRRMDELADGWDRFARGWDERWRAAEDRCRFERFAETGLGVAFDRVAWVHQSLPEAKLKYAEQMARFTTDLAAEVAAMTRALDKSRADLESRGHPKD